MNYKIHAYDTYFMSLLLQKQLRTAAGIDWHPNETLTPVTIGGLTCPAGVTGAISGVYRLQPIFHH